MPRIVAIDYGLKRVGIAVTDPDQVIATALDTVHSKDIISYLKSYTQKESVECFVVGEPRQMNNRPSEISPQIEAFIRTLAKNFPGIPIERADERFTSSIASRSLIESGLKKKARQDKSLVDQVSAVLILQSYMEGRANNK